MHYSALLSTDNVSQKLRSRKIVPPHLSLVTDQYICVHFVFAVWNNVAKSFAAHLQLKTSERFDTLHRWRSHSCCAGAGAAHK